MGLFTKKSDSRDKDGMRKEPLPVLRQEVTAKWLANAVVEGKGQEELQACLRRGLGGSLPPKEMEELQKRAQYLALYEIPQKKLASHGPQYPAYHGKKADAVCDVCGRPLSLAFQVFLVPNADFYASDKYREYYKKKSASFNKELLSRLPGMENVLEKAGGDDTFGDASFMVLMERDNSKGSAVCDDCIHMF